MYVFKVKLLLMQHVQLALVDDFQLLQERIISIESGESD